MAAPRNLPPDPLAHLEAAVGKYLRDRPAVEALLDAGDTAAGYLHWEEWRHRPAPEGWTAEELWALLQTQRRRFRRLEGLCAKDGQPFRLVHSDPMTAALHRIDKKEVLWKGLRRGGEALGSNLSYRLMAAIEEAHHSSAIEGAVTTRRRSRELIRSGGEPRNRSERMILNNFRTIQRLDEWVGEELTPELLCAVQACVTDGTLDDPADVGRIRRDDRVEVVDALTGEVVHVPPPAAEIPGRLERLCAFANAGDDEPFLHPVVRAILLHHQLAYDHPFADGNGRTARALFMWSVLRADYPWFRSLSISRAVNRAKAGYYRAFRFVQSDRSDATYFVRQQLRCIEREIEHLGRFLERRARLERWMVGRRAITAELNTRQLALVEHALGDPDAPPYTADGHARYHGVSQPTAWKDLSGMVRLGLLAEARQGRRKAYRPTTVLERLRAERPEGI